MSEELTGRALKSMGMSRFSKEAARRGSDRTGTRSCVQKGQLSPQARTDRAVHSVVAGADHALACRSVHVVNTALALEVRRGSGLRVAGGADHRLRRQMHQIGDTLQVDGNGATLQDATLRRGCDITWDLREKGVNKEEITTGRCSILKQTKTLRQRAQATCRLREMAEYFSRNSDSKYARNGKDEESASTTS